MDESSRPVLAYSLKVRDRGFIDIALFRSEKPELGSFLKLNVYDGKSYARLFLNKKEASFLAQMIQMLVDEGCKLDYKLLTEKYPEQRTWHIR